MLQPESNKNVFSSPLNCPKLAFCCGNLISRSFYSRGPAALKLLSPISEPVITAKNRGKFSYV